MTSVLADLGEQWVLETFPELDRLQASWLQPGPPPRELLVGERELLAPGFWIVRYRRWVPATDLADHNADLPLATLLEEPPAPAMPDEDDWHVRALCRGEPIHSFYGTDESRGQPSLHPSVLKRTREKFCAPCPVRRDCLLEALRRRDTYGIWGGLSGRARKAMHEVIDQRPPGERYATMLAMVEKCL